MTEYIHITPPGERYYIVYSNDMLIIHHGTLSETSNHLSSGLPQIEIFTEKQIFIDRLLEMGIEYKEIEPGEWA